MAQQRVPIQNVPKCMDGQEDVDGQYRFLTVCKGPNGLAFRRMTFDECRTVDLNGKPAKCAQFISGVSIDPADPTFLLVETVHMHIPLGPDGKVQAKFGETSEEKTAASVTLSPEAAAAAGLLAQ